MFDNNPQPRKKLGIEGEEIVAEIDVRVDE